MKCPKCHKEIDYLIASQVVHIDVKVDEYGNYLDNLNEGDLYNSAFEFEDPTGDYACPECGEYSDYLSDFKE